ncbi:MAG: hypothetical protein Q9166_000716 [cf. Caloplaca sp. 2 TL-2023]
MSSGPVIPPRTSSKRAADDELERDKVKLAKVELDIEKGQKKLKPQNSFDSEFWRKRAEIDENRIVRNKLQTKLSIEQFRAEGGTENEFAGSDQAQAFSIERQALEVQMKLSKKQSEDLQIGSGDVKKAIRRGFLQVYTTSKLGLGQNSGSGKRDGRLQSTFRNALCKETESRPDRGGVEFRCPIIKKWLNPSSMTAAHLFPYSSGQALMTAIFGSDADNELFSPLNGMLISTRAEKLLADGFLLIVPDVPDKPSRAEILEWQNSDPKQYVIKIPYPNELKVQQRTVDEGTQRFVDLHNTKVEFFTKFRPRARYMYWTYISGTLRQEWRAKNPDAPYAQVLTSEFGKPYWGSPGPWLKKTMLRAFVEELGHEFNGQLDFSEEATPEASGAQDEVDYSALFLASEQIGHSASQIIKAEQGNDETEDEDDEGDDDGQTVEARVD